MSRQFVHSTALVESEAIGEGTCIWAYSHVLNGAVIGRDCNIGDHCFIEGASIGDDVTIKNGVMVWEGVTIELSAFIGPGATFTNDRYPRSPRASWMRERYAGKENWLVATRVGQGATVGAGAIILAGVTIGAYAFVAAGALVTCHVPPHALVRGSPGRVDGSGVPLRALASAGWRCRLMRRLRSAV